MKLAEALKLRKRLQQKINELNEKITENAYVKDGEEPVYNLSNLIEERKKFVEDLRALKVKIIRTNVETLVGGESIAEAIIRLSDKSEEISVLKSLPTKRSEEDRYSYKEIERKVVLQYNVKENDAAIALLEKEKEELDSAIQATNWSTKV